MYAIYADGSPLWRPTWEGHEVIDPHWNWELNKAGSLRFTLPPDHPMYSSLKKLRTTIDLYDGAEHLWRGRVLMDDGIDFDNMKEVYCEGALSFFNDSVVRPYSFTGTISDYFTFLVAQHNEQVDLDRQFLVGDCDITNEAGFIYRASTMYPSTFEEMDDKLLDYLGGYFVITFDGDQQIINYRKEPGELSEQTIVFGENLIDITQYIDASDLYTIIVPLGATIEEESNG